MKVALVTGDSGTSRYLAAALQQAGVVNRVILERPRLPRRFLVRKLKQVGPLDMAFQLWLTRRFRHESAAVLPTIAPAGWSSTRDINTLSFAPDELVLAFGTSYVRRSTLERVPHGILNLHTGLLPQYRGVKSEFWCQFNRDPAGAGWTLHYMVPELDAGDIVVRQPVPWEGESPGALRAKIVCDAAAGIAAFLTAHRNGTPIARHPQGPGTYYSAPRFRQWLEVQRRGPLSPQPLNQ